MHYQSTMMTKKTSIPVFKQALNKRPSSSKRGAGASNKENRDPSAAGPAPAKQSGSAKGKSPVATKIAKPVQKSPPACRYADVCDDDSFIPEDESSICAEAGDSYRVISIANAEDSLVLTKDRLTHLVLPEDVTLEYHYSPAEPVVQLHWSYFEDVVVPEQPAEPVTENNWSVNPNDSLVLTRQRLAYLILPEDVTLEYRYSPAEPVSVTELHHSYFEGVVPEHNCSFVDDCTFDLSQELRNVPEERLLDESLTGLMNVEIDYSLEFPTGALGRVPHINVAKYKRDMKRKAAEEKAKLPTLLLTSPSDGDLAQMAKAEVEFEYDDIVNGSYKAQLLDGSLHNWMMRFYFDNMVEFAASKDDESDMMTESDGTESDATEFDATDIPQLLVTSPSDGDLLCGEGNSCEMHFMLQDIVDNSYKTHLLDASFHNWNMRFNLEGVLREVDEYEQEIANVNELSCF